MQEIFRYFKHELYQLCPNSRVLFFQILFVGTGVFQTIGNQFVYYQGAAEKTTMLPLVANFLGTALAIFQPSSRSFSTPSKGKPPLKLLRLHLQMLIAALFECLGNAVGLIGMILAGSGVSLINPHHHPHVDLNEITQCSSA
jgi:hypothetical protein